MREKNPVSMTIISPEKNKRKILQSSYRDQT